MILFLLTALGTLVCYLLTGLLAAKLSTPRLVRKYAPTGSPAVRLVRADGGRAYYVRDPGGDLDRWDVRRGQVLILFLWPVLLPAAWFASVLDAETDRHDPALHRKQAERIAELEQELGLR
jgi:hypothetical protein